MTEPREPPAAATPPPPPRPPRFARLRQAPWKLITAGIVLVPILLFVLYTAFVLNWAYSEGDRSGVLYKLSRKGWLCKTWEGELNLTPGAAAPSIWSFSVRDEAVAKQLNEAMGKRVALHYSEHLGVPTNCFGDTRYFVDAFRNAKE